MEYSQFPRTNKIAYEHIRKVLKYDKNSHFYGLCDDIIDYMETQEMERYYKEFNREPDFRVIESPYKASVYWNNRGYDLPVKIVINNMPDLDEFDLYDLLCYRRRMSITKIWLRDNDLPYKITIGGRMHYKNKFCANNIKYQLTRVAKISAIILGSTMLFSTGVILLESLKLTITACVITLI